MSRRTIALATAGALAALVGAIAAPSTAQACLLGYCPNPSGADGKTMPGNACTIKYSDSNHSAGYDDLGRVCNYDTNDAVVVTCPLLRDKWGSTDGLACVAAYMTRSDDAPTGCGLSNYSSWECIVQSKDETGIYGDWAGWDSMASIGLSSFVQGTGYAKGFWQAKLPFGYAVQDNSPWYMGSYFLSCELPPTYLCGGSNCLSSVRWVE